MKGKDDKYYIVDPVSKTRMKYVVPEGEYAKLICPNGDNLNIIESKKSKISKFKIKKLKLSLTPKSCGKNAITLKDYIDKIYDKVYKKELEEIIANLKNIMKAE